MLIALSAHNVSSLSSGERVANVTEDDQRSTDARNGAFRNLVLGLYDNRCTACGLRLIIGNMRIVDAAHLVPWSESHNDHPSNGIALCKNHHWAMDRQILAPGADRKWHISPRLDQRVKDHQDLIKLDGMTLFEPNEERFSPNEANLRWRHERLLA